MSRSREFLYQMIATDIRDAFDHRGDWRNEEPAAITERAMRFIRAGLSPKFDSAAVDDAIETIRYAAEQGTPIRLDGKGPWYQLTECDPPGPRQARVLAVDEPSTAPADSPRKEDT